MNNDVVVIKYDLYLKPSIRTNTPSFNIGILAIQRAYIEGSPIFLGLYDVDKVEIESRVTVYPQ